MVTPDFNNIAATRMQIFSMCSPRMHVNSIRVTETRKGSAQTLRLACYYDRVIMLL
jgi:hypothetical protein